MTAADLRQAQHATRHVRWREGRRQPSRDTISPELLKRVRKGRGLSLSNVAVRFGVSRGTWVKWESGLDVPGRHRLAELQRWVDSWLSANARAADSGGVPVGTSEAALAIARVKRRLVEEDLHPWKTDDDAAFGRRSARGGTS